MPDLRQNLKISPVALLYTPHHAGRKSVPKFHFFLASLERNARFARKKFLIIATNFRLKTFVDVFFFLQE